MRVIRFSDPTDPTDQSVRWGELDGDVVRELSAAPWAGGSPTGQVHAAIAVRLHAPVTPGKVIAVGRNSRAHADEMGWTDAEPILFLKPTSAVIGPDDPIVLPPETSRCEPEGELAIVIGSGGRRLSTTEAKRAIAGYTIANDVSARDLMTSDGQWSRAKGFDSFCPVGPWVDTAFHAADARIVTRVGVRVVQDGGVDQMVLGAAEVVALASSAFSLEPGDLILAGSPAGRSTLRGGDRVEIEVPGLGTLCNPVIEEVVGELR